MLVNFRHFRIKEQAEQIGEILLDNGIQPYYKEVQASIDVTFADNNPIEYWIQIAKEDMEKAEFILNEQGQNVDAIPDGHYLLDFDDEELIDILKNYSDWNDTDYILARKVLLNRGVEYTDNEILRFKEQKIEELKAPEKGKSVLVILGYFLSLLGGLFGLAIGWNFWTEINTLPNGDQVLRYDDSTIKHGKAMVVISLTVIVLTVLITISRYME
jgi:hypothetical protein